MNIKAYFQKKKLLKIYKAEGIEIFETQEEVDAYETETGNRAMTTERALKFVSVLNQSKTNKHGEQKEAAENEDEFCYKY